MGASRCQARQNATGQPGRAPVDGRHALPGAVLAPEANELPETPSDEACNVQAPPASGPHWPFAVGGPKE
jgi:hypothetical protein